MGGDEGWIWLVNVNVADTFVLDVAIVVFRVLLDRSRGGNTF